MHAILVHTSRVNLEEHGAKVDTVRSSPVNLDGQDSTKSVYMFTHAFMFTSEVYRPKRFEGYRTFLQIPNVLWI